MGTGAGDEEAKVSVSSWLDHGGDTAWKDAKVTRGETVNRDARQGRRAGDAPPRNLPGRHAPVQSTAMEKSLSGDSDPVLEEGNAGWKAGGRIESQCHYQARVENWATVLEGAEMGRHSSAVAMRAQGSRAAGATTQDANSDGG